MNIKDLLIWLPGYETFAGKQWITGFALFCLWLVGWYFLLVRANIIWGIVLVFGAWLYELFIELLLKSKRWSGVGEIFRNLLIFPALMFLEFPSLVLLDKITKVFPGYFQEPNLFGWAIMLAFVIPPFLPVLWESVYKGEAFHPRFQSLPQKHKDFVEQKSWRRNFLSMPFASPQFHVSLLWKRFLPVLEKVFHLKPPFVGNIKSSFILAAVGCLALFFGFFTMGAVAILLKIDIRDIVY